MHTKIHNLIRLYLGPFCNWKQETTRHNPGLSVFDAFFYLKKSRKKIPTALFSCNVFSVYRAHKFHVLGHFGI